MSRLLDGARLASVLPLFLATACSLEAESLFGKDGATGSSTASSSSSGGGPLPLPCDQVTCDANADQSCGWDRYQVFGAPRGVCVKGTPANDGCSTMADGYGPETRIECSSTDQCSAGQVCCARRTVYQEGNQSAFIYESVRCESSCEFPGFLTCTPGVTACPMIPTQNGPVQSVCKASSLLPDGDTICGYPN